MSQTYKISFKRVLAYIGWGCLLTFFITIQLKKTDLVSILILVALSSILIYIIEYFTLLIFYKDAWWDKFNNSIICDCNTCKDWRGDNRNKLFLIRILSSIPIIAACYFLIPHITNLSEIEKYDKVEKKVNKSYVTKDFTVVSTLNRELVDGKVGRYYKISLKNVTCSKKILFNAEEYTINQLEDELLIPFNVFLDSVYNVIAKGYKCELFVKGSADYEGNSTFKRKFHPDFSKKQGFTNFKILPRINDGFSSVYKDRIIMQTITNSDLPDLRGKFLQYTFQKYIKDLPPFSILEGNVTSNISSEDRNVYLYMFVDWNSKKQIIFPKWIISIFQFLAFFSFSVPIKSFKNIDISFGT